MAILRVVFAGVIFTISYVWKVQHSLDCAAIFLHLAKSFEDKLSCLQNIS